MSAAVKSLLPCCLVAYNSLFTTVLDFVRLYNALFFPAVLSDSLFTWVVPSEHDDGQVLRQNEVVSYQGQQKLSFG